MNFEDTLKRALNDNLGNKITMDLGNGLYATLIEAYNVDIKALKNPPKDEKGK